MNIVVSPSIIDQAHEQAHTVVRSDDGAINVTGYPATLRRWMVAGPEVRSLITQYETTGTTNEGTVPTMQPS